MRAVSRALAAWLSPDCSLMTTPNFESRYQLLKCVAVADGVRTHNALETVTGRVVMVHLADAAGPDAVAALRGMLGRLSSQDKARILETATVSSGFAIVTEFLQGLTSFPEWLDQRALPELLRGDRSDVEGFSVEALRQPSGTLDYPPPAPAAPPPAPSPFGAAAPPREAAPPPLQPVQPPVQPPAAMESAPVAPPPPARPPGEFTSLFGVMAPPTEGAFSSPPAPPEPHRPEPAPLPPPPPAAARPPEPAPPPPARPEPPPSSPLLGDHRLSTTGASPLSSADAAGRAHRTGDAGPRRASDRSSAAPAGGTSGSLGSVVLSADARCATDFRATDFRATACPPPLRHRLSHRRRRRRHRRTRLHHLHPRLRMRARRSRRWRRVSSPRCSSR